MLGKLRGVSCIDRLTRPFRYPKSVPVTRLPDGPRNVSDRPDGRDGILHAGVMIGKDRNTDRKTRKTLVLCFLRLDGGTREEEDEEEQDCGGGGGGGGGAEKQSGDSGWREVVAVMVTIAVEVEVDFGSPMHEGKVIMKQ